MTYLLAGLVLCITVVLAGWVLEKLEERWSNLPHFKFNFVGGNFAVCSSSDFTRGRALERPGKDSLIVVPDTLVFSNKVETAPMLFSGGLSSDWARRYPVPALFWRWPKSEMDERLFVPFASTALLDPAEQERTFMSPIKGGNDLATFIGRKVAANRKADFRLRFRDWMWRTGYTISLAQVAFGLVGVCLLVLLFLVMNAADKNKPVTVHLTDPDTATVREMRMTEEEARRFPVGADSDIVYKGKIVEVQDIGGGIAHACVKSISGRISCGFADSSRGFSPGDTACVRTASIVSWTGGQYVHHEFSSWLITEREALALEKAGYHIEE